MKQCIILLFVLFNCNYSFSQFVGYEYTHVSKNLENLLYFEQVSQSEEIFNLRDHFADKPDLFLRYKVYKVNYNTYIKKSNIKRFQKDIKRDIDDLQEIVLFLEAEQGEQKLIANAISDMKVYMIAYQKLYQDISAANNLQKAFHIQMQTEDDKKLIDLYEYFSAAPLQFIHEKAWEHNEKIFDTKGIPNQADAKKYIFHMKKDHNDLEKIIKEIERTKNFYDNETKSYDILVNSLNKLLQEIKEQKDVYKKVIESLDTTK